MFFKQINRKLPPICPWDYNWTLNHSGLLSAIVVLPMLEKSALEEVDDGYFQIFCILGSPSSEKPAFPELLYRALA